MHALATDIRASFRGIYRRPALPMIVVATLALGIGMNTMMFTVVNGVLLKPLPLPDADRLMMVWETTPTGSRTVASAANFADWSASAEGFSSLAAMAGWDVLLEGADQSRRLIGGRVTEDFLPVLGIQPLVGRGFGPNDFRPEGAPVVLLSHSLWRSAFAENPQLVGQELKLSAGIYTVIGVMPPQAERAGYNRQIWSPLRLNMGPWLEHRGRHNILVSGRLSPGVERTEAQAQLSEVAKRLASLYTETNEGYGVDVQPLHEVLVGSSEQSLKMLWGAVGFVLLIACANVAHLMMVRMNTRRGEMAISAALGAGRLRLLRRLLMETGMMALLGGTLGIGLAAASLTSIASMLPRSLPGAGELGIDASVLLFTLVLMGTTTLLTGVLPALQVSGTASRLAVDGGELAFNVTGSRRRGSDMLIVAEFALAVVLLIGAGLFLRSLSNLNAVQLGIEPRGVYAATLHMPADPYRESAQLRDAASALVAALRERPGVEEASMTSQLPFTGSGLGFSFGIEGGVEAGPSGPNANLRVVSPSFFRTLNMPLKGGRGFDSGDRPNTTPVVVVSEALARQYFPGGDAVGNRISFESDPSGPVWAEIVGVVSDVRDLGPGAPPLQLVYQSALQSEQPWQWTNRSTYLVARMSSAESVEGAEETIRAVVRLVAPSVPVEMIQSLLDGAAATTAPSRFQARILALFGGVAIFLAGIGVYGVLSYNVSQRTRELGLRKALGARSGVVVREVMLSGLKLLAFGTLIGLPLAFGVSSWIRGLLHEVELVDPTVYFAVPALLVLAGLLASFRPAFRAAEVDPMEALRGP